MYKLEIIKRYPGNRYEYLIHVSYPISNSIKSNTDKKLDIFSLFKKGNHIIAEKTNRPSLVGPLFCSLNMPNQWFWSKKSINITENTTHMSNDHLMNIISYISPFPFNVYLYADFNTTNNKSYQICTLNDCKLYREIDGQKKLLDTNPYSSYYLFKLPPGKRLVFSCETEFAIPYIFKNEYDIDAQMEIKDVILFDVIDKTMLKINPEQKYIYTNLEINKKSVQNTFLKSSNTCAKFRRPHIMPILPSYTDDKKIYEAINITKEKYDNYHSRIKHEDSMDFIDHDKYITVSFSIIGSSIYTIRYLHDALLNLRRNFSQFTFNDKQFISDIITLFIEKLESFK